MAPDSKMGDERRARWAAASTYPIGQGWNVSAELFYADDYAAFILNGTTVLDTSFGEAKKDKVDLQGILQDGENTLRVVCFNLHPPVWSFRYRIGVFDQAGKPAMDAIDLSPKGTTPHSGAQHDVIYTFIRT